MGSSVSRDDFEWTYNEEPHASRRKLILAKYPQMKELFGHDSNMVYKVGFMLTLQLIACYFVQDAPWPVIILLAYCFGGVINHAMMTAIHEISHNLAFWTSRPLHNRILGIVGNVIIAVPISISFKKYHLEHHRYQGNEEMDMDLPSKMEGVLFHTTFTKCIWLLLQPFFYAFRPLFLRPKPVTGLEIINTAVQIAFDVAIWYFLGGKSLAYLMIGTPLAMGAHPVAGHFISEHYMFKKGYETYSYYGPLNAITFNAGYHNEHHDFPNIPGCRLPKVREIAPEFYNNLPCHTSWTRVLYDFVTDPDIGPYARVKRRSRPIPINPANLDVDGDIKAE
ncbi:PREDICTED: LOW QUALITY PROTEIN: sphingolipid delta(4)-desaturase DES1-like [Branchiostoma belcheri]|uniref:sphingolipid 4-desaturase n=1 Tax=Branchiostoma belcheri TaxID=7741 RepID=A0A6P5A231_BRABE|nr:PREDICTED: LOW QUALITY PROTEIN: sphingolipid delta(4)-desaturase DES1-like [Branchiostoma belcheri]